jgi:hypothetical protein
VIDYNNGYDILASGALAIDGIRGAARPHRRCGWRGRMRATERKIGDIKAGAEQNVMETKEFAVESQNRLKSMSLKIKRFADRGVGEGPPPESIYLKQKELTVK